MLLSPKFSWPVQNTFPSEYLVNSLLFYLMLLELIISKFKIHLGFFFYTDCTLKSKYKTNKSNLYPQQKIRNV